MPEKKKTAPRLRFPEFRNAGPWVVKRLGDLGKILKGKGISKSDITEGGALACIHYGELYTHYPEVIREIVSSTDVNPDNLVLSEKNDVIIPASGETREDIATASCLTEKGVALGGDLNIFRSALNGAFLAYYIRGNLKAEISRVAQGDAVVHLYPSQLEKVKLAIPPKRNEQQKIADFLSSLDDLIRAEGAALEALKKHKKGLMQRLFPREGETTPLLRFPEFRDAGEWEVKRLGEVFLERNERNGSDLELLSVTMSDGVVRAADLERKNSASADLSNYKKVYPNDIVYNSMRMWQGASGVSSWSGIVSPAYTVITPKQNQEPLFWAYYFKLESAIEKFRRYSQGVTSDTWNLKYPAFSSIKLALPSSPDEQLKIANCLASLDDLIRARSKRIEALKQHKKGLMQQLFPQEVG